MTSENRPEASTRAQHALAAGGRALEILRTSRAALVEFRDRCASGAGKLNAGIPDGDPVHPCAADLTWPMSTAGLAIERPDEAIGAVEAANVRTEMRTEAAASDPEAQAAGDPPAGTQRAGDTLLALVRAYGDARFSVGVLGDDVMSAKEGRAHQQQADRLYRVIDAALTGRGRPTAAPEAVLFDAEDIAELARHYVSASTLYERALEANRLAQEHGRFEAMLRRLHGARSISEFHGLLCEAQGLLDRIAAHDAPAEASAAKEQLGAIRERGA